MTEKKCPVCRKTFIAQRSTAKYCSDRCRMRAYRERKGREEWFKWAYRATANGIDTLRVFLRDDEYQARAYRALKDIQAELSDIA